MKTLKIEDGDIVLSVGKVVLVEGKERLIQDIKEILGTSVNRLGYGCGLDELVGVQSDLVEGVLSMRIMGGLKVLREFQKKAGRVDSGVIRDLSSVFLFVRRERGDLRKYRYYLRVYSLEGVGVEVVGGGEV